MNILHGSYKYKEIQDRYGRCLMVDKVDIQGVCLFEIVSGEFTEEVNLKLMHE